MAQRVAFSSNIFIHRNEPLRRVAKDHRLFRAPRVRVLVLESAARDQHAGATLLFGTKSLNYRIVGITLLTLVGKHALANEAWSLIGEPPIGIDSVGNGSVNAPSGQLLRIRSPDVEIIASVARRGVHKAGPRIVGDMIAG